MKAYVYIDLDSRLSLRTAEYIDTVDPGFFLNNSHYIIKYWKVDTDDKHSLWRMMKYCKDYKINLTEFRNILMQLGVISEDTKSKDFDEKMHEIGKANH